MALGAGQEILPLWMGLSPQQIQVNLTVLMRFEGIRIKDTTFVPARALTEDRV